MMAGILVSIQPAGALAATSGQKHARAAKKSGIEKPSGLLSLAGLTGTMGTIELSGTAEAANVENSLFASLNDDSVVSKLLEGYTSTANYGKTMNYDEALHDAVASGYDTAVNYGTKNEDTLKSKGSNSRKKKQQQQKSTTVKTNPDGTIKTDISFDDYFDNFQQQHVKSETPMLIIYDVGIDDNRKIEDLKKSLLQTGTIAKMVDSLDKGVNGMGKVVGDVALLEKKCLQNEIQAIQRYYFMPDGVTFQPGRTQEGFMKAVTEAKGRYGGSSAKAANVYGKAAPVLAVASVALNGYVVYNDVKDLATGNLKNRTTTGKVMECTGLVANAGVALWGIVVTTGAVLGVTVTGVPLVVGVAVGLTAGAIHSDWFADWFDEYGQKIDNTVSEGITIVKESWNIVSETAADNAEVLLDYLKDLLGIRTTVPNSVNCYKPNIYIYTDEPKQVTVTFARPDLLTKTIPVYEDGWRVKADRSGLLTPAVPTGRNGMTDALPTGRNGMTDALPADRNQSTMTLPADNRESYVYLFYESKTQMHFFQKEEAWLIKSDTRKEQYEQILKEYGFNEQEIADFVEFWTEKLPQGTDYLMYPQNTAIVNRAMPIQILPKPDSMERMWFVFVTDDGRSVKEPKTEAIKRNAYAVVEWGGIIADE